MMIMRIMTMIMWTITRRRNSKIPKAHGNKDENGRKQTKNQLQNSTRMEQSKMRHAS